MKHRLASLTFILTSLAISPLAVHAQPAAPEKPGTPAKPASAAKEETELEGKMDAMNGAFRKLRRQVSDAAKNDESLKLVAEIRSASAASQTLTPARAADIPEADRARFIAAYQAKMKEFDAKLGELEAALKAGKNEDAAKIIPALSAMQKEGHKEFKRPDKN